jgi:hypothetical protein
MATPYMPWAVGICGLGLLVLLISFRHYFAGLFKRSPRPAESVGPVSAEKITSGEAVAEDMAGEDTAAVAVPALPAKPIRWDIWTGVGLLLLGQALLVATAYTTAAIVVCSLGALVLIVIFRLYRALHVGPGGRRVLFFGLSVGAAYFATQLVYAKPLVTLWLFVLAGLLLAVARPQPQAEDILGYLPNRRKPFAAWEAVLFVGIVVVAFLSRFGQMHGFPFGAIMEEALHGHVSQIELLGSSYEPYFRDSNMGIPTLIGYLGLLAAKFRGFHIDNLRLSVEFFGFASILVFYFACRTYTSRETAVIATVLYLGSALHMSLSHRFYPYAVVFFAPVAGFAFFNQGMKKSRGIFFLLAGLAVGFSLHGYEPGRGVFLIFLCWQAWLWLFHRATFPRWKYIGFFWLGFVIVGSPILYFMITNWKGYWWYVIEQNPNRNAGLYHYYVHLKSRLPMHSLMFQVRGTGNHTVQIQYDPLLGPITAAIFGGGLFLTLFLFWRPIPAFLLLLFGAGIMPAMLGYDPNPNFRRVCLIIPAIYLICGLALERVRQFFMSFRWPGLCWLYLAAGLSLAIPAAYSGIHYYFDEYGTSPEARTGFSLRSVKIVEALRQHPDARSSGQSYMFVDAFAVLMKPRVVDAYATLEEYLILDKTHDQLIFFEGYMEPLLPFFQRHFPHAQIRTFREPNLTGEFAQSWEFYEKGTDAYNPSAYLCQVWIPAEDVRQFQSLLLAGPAGTHTPCPVWEDDFSEKFSGRRLPLAGAVFTKSGGDFVFQTPGPGWSLAVDDQAAGWGKPLRLDGGVHYFRIDGRISSGQKGPLNFDVLEHNTSLRTQGRIAGLTQERTCRVEVRKGEKVWDGTPVLTRHELFPIKRFYDLTEFPYTHSVHFTGRLRVPQDGEYRFEAKPFASIRLVVNDHQVFDNFANWYAPVKDSVVLKGGQSVVWEGFMEPKFTPMHRTFLMYYRRTGDKETLPVPLEWFE